jgi:hypothetical protein
VTNIKGAPKIATIATMACFQKLKSFAYGAIFGIIEIAAANHNIYTIINVILINKILLFNLYKYYNKKF